MERGQGGEVSPPTTLTPLDSTPMNFRLTAVLFAVVLALVVGLLIYALNTADPQAASDGPFAALVAAGVKPADVTAVELERTSPKDEKLVFEKADGKWRLTFPTDAGVDSAALDALVGELFALKPKEMSGPVERANTGLTKPEVKVTLKAGDKSAAVHVGDTTFGSDQNAVTFLVSATDPDIRPMAVLTGKLRSGLFRPDAKDGKPATLVKWRSDFRPRALIGGDTRDTEADSAAVTVVRGDKTLALARTDDGWRFTAPELGAADVSGASEPDATRFTGVRPLLNALLFLQTGGAVDVTEDVPAAELPRFGLAPADNPLTVTYTAKGKPPQTLLIGKRLTDKEGKPLVPTRHHVKLAGDAAVFAVTTDVTDKLVNTLNDPTSLQNRDLLPPAKVALVDAIDSSVGGGFQLRKLAAATDTWGLYGGGGEPAEAQVLAVQTLLTKLAAPRVAADVLPKPDDAAFDAASLQAVLKVWVGGVNKDKAKTTDGKLPPEPPVTGEPTVTLKIGKQFVKTVTKPDGTTEGRMLVAVRRTAGKDSTDLEVPLDAVAPALHPRIKFVNARPPALVPSQATAVVLFRDGTRTEYVKNPTATDPAYRFGVWNVGDTKGPVADGDALLELLGRLASAPAGLLMEKADDPKPLGLDPANPKLSVKVTRPAEKGGTRTDEYHLGEPVKGDDTSVYLKAVDKPFVYGVPADLFARLRTADLTDKVAFRVPTARVKSVTMRGWAATTPDKAKVKLEATLQNGAWVATEPKGAALDPVAMAAWLDALRFPKSVGPAPVEPGNDPPAAYGLGFDGVNLLVISSAEKPGDPDTGLALTLGAVVPDKGGVYARLSDGRVFLLDAGPFALPLARPPFAAK